MILCYPVITMASPQYVHEGSKTHLLGEEPSLSLVDKMSTEKQVTKNTPPTFLWHTADDGAVPVENSLMFARSLGDCNVPYSKREEIDRWLLSKYNGLVKNVTLAFLEYDLNKVTRYIANFVSEDLSNWYIRRNRKSDC